MSLIKLSGHFDIIQSAAQDNWFAHLAVEVPAEGASNGWLEPVNDEAYGTYSGLF